MSWMPVITIAKWLPREGVPLEKKKPAAVSMHIYVQYMTPTTAFPSRFNGASDMYSFSALLRT